MKVYLTPDLSKALKNPLKLIVPVTLVVHASELMMQRSSLEENYHKAVNLKFDFIFTKNKAITSHFERPIASKTRVVLFENASSNIGSMKKLVFSELEEVFRSGSYQDRLIVLSYKKLSIYA